jgi:ribosomal protein S18 acetylase RimI-like enzyme
MGSGMVRIEPWNPAWGEAFLRLNVQWLERYFVVEALDARVLRDPERHVLAPGGAIFFAVRDGEPIGTCALIRESEGVYEVSKMAVDTAHQGRGAGRLLLDAVIAEFHARGGGTLFLESSSRLERALDLYRRAGFEMQPQVRPGSHYARADVYMIYRGDRPGPVADA